MGSKKKKPKKGKTTAADDDVFDDEYKPVDVMANLQMESSPSPLSSTQGGNDSSFHEHNSLDHARKDIIQGEQLVLAYLTYSPSSSIIFFV